MKFIKEWSGVVALVILAIIYVVGFTSHKTVFGSATSCTDGYTCFTNLEVQGSNLIDGVITMAGGSKVGSSGTTLNTVLEGKSSLIASSFTVGATTTVSMDIAATGALTGDTVFASFATTSSVGGWAIVGASASTTAGFDTLRVMNLTGASNVIPASIASSSVSYHNSR